MRTQAHLRVPIRQQQQRGGVLALEQRLVRGGDEADEHEEVEDGGELAVAVQGHGEAGRDGAVGVVVVVGGRGGGGGVEAAEADELGGQSLESRDRGGGFRFRALEGEEGLVEAFVVVRGPGGLVQRLLALAQAEPVEVERRRRFQRPGFLGRLGFDVEECDHAEADAGGVDGVALCEWDRSG